MKKRILAFLALAAGAVMILHYCGTGVEEESTLSRIYHTVRAEVILQYAEPELDRSRLDTDTTKKEDRIKYYEKRVDSVENYLIDKLEDSFYVTLFVEYKNKEDYNNDMIFLKRNDDVVNGFLEDNSHIIIVPPGIYEVRSSEVNENYGTLGEIEILKYGGKYDLSIDYDNCKATIE